MAKSGQARVLNSAQFARLLSEIEQHRHPEKNAAIMQISFKLALRAQEIALLEIKEVARIVGGRLVLKEILSLPASYTKGANATRNGAGYYRRSVVSFKVADFDRVVEQIAALAKAGAPIDPQSFYPPKQRRSGKARDLPMTDPALRAALERYLEIRLEQDPHLKPTSPLFVTQKGGPYSPNTLQEHMKLMLAGWAGVEKASSHSGRRTVATDIIHGQGHSIRVAQKVLGHKNPATTVIYEEPPEELVGEALRGVGEKFSGE